MKLSEARQLKAGDMIFVNLGNGWRQQGEFVRLVKVTRFPNMTFADIATFDPTKGKEETRVMYKYIDDHGKQQTDIVSARKVMTK